MILIVISLILGFTGMCIGSTLGVEYLAVLLSILGVLSPTIFVLEKIYKRNNGSNELSNDDYIDTLEGLKDNNIITELECEEANLKFKELTEKAENKIQYDKGVDVLFKLSQGGTISEEGFHEKIRLLKSLYKQK